MLLKNVDVSKTDTKDVNIRPFKIWDFILLNKTYDELSEETKKYFHPGFLGFKEYNLIGQIKLAISSFRFIQKILKKILPKFLILSLIAFLNKEIAGFAFLEFKQKVKIGFSTKFSAHFGIFVVEKYQNMGIGTLLMSEILKVAKINDVGEITLTVLSDNLKAIRLYKKFGFECAGETTDKWKEKEFPSKIMKLKLNF
ncbi:MAG: GNAT family N-acetyltransferase [Nitrososphaerota archaeon]